MAATFGSDQLERLVITFLDVFGVDFGELHRVPRVHFEVLGLPLPVVHVSVDVLFHVPQVANDRFRIVVCAQANLPQSLLDQLILAIFGVDDAVSTAAETAFFFGHEVLFSALVALAQHVMNVQLELPDQVLVLQQIVQELDDRVVQHAGTHENVDGPQRHVDVRLVVDFDFHFVDLAIFAVQHIVDESAISHCARTWLQYP